MEFRQLTCPFILPFCPFILRRDKVAGGGLKTMMDVEFWMVDSFRIFLQAGSGASGRMALFQVFEIVRCEQGAHLADGDFIELQEALGLGNTLADENGIEALEICEDDKLLKRSMVADVAFGIGMSIAPLLGGLSEQRDIKQIGFVGIDKRCLGLGECRRQECFFDGVGVDAVVNLCEGPLEVPAELEAVVFVVLEAAKFFDQIDFKLGANPHAELESDVGMGKRAAIATSGGFEANGIGFLNPFFDAELVAVQSGLTFNDGEFAVIKIWVEHGLPDAKEFHGIPVAEPVGDKKLAILRPQHVGQGDIVAILAGQNRYRCSPNGDGAGFILAHGKKLFHPVSFLNLSNSRGLKFGLQSFSQSPRKSMVLRLCIQLLMMAKGSCKFRYRAMSVRER